MQRCRRVLLGLVSPSNQWQSLTRWVKLTVISKQGRDPAEWIIFMYKKERSQFESDWSDVCPWHWCECFHSFNTFPVHISLLLLNQACYFTLWTPLCSPSNHFSSLLLTKIPLLMSKQKTPAAISCGNVKPKLLKAYSAAFCEISVKHVIFSNTKRSILSQ